MVTLPTADFWRTKRVMLTGHTGFKGGWLALWLKRLGATVLGIALPPETHPNLFDLANIGEQIESHFCDVRDGSAVEHLVETFAPHIVFHLAAMPLVRRSYREPIDTIATNVMGTANLLESIRKSRCAKVIVVVTTDKVYQPSMDRRSYSETDPLGGHDPYSASKASCELIANAYSSSFLEAQGVALSTARAGNVIGGGDWSEDRLIPDAMRAWQRGSVLRIRNPDAVRPWQHVLDPLAGYLLLAEALWDTPGTAGAYNFGPADTSCHTVREVIERARQIYGDCQVFYEEAPSGPSETSWLALDTTKTRSALGSTPRWDTNEALLRTLLWYQRQRAGSDAHMLCERDIADFENAQ